MPFEAKRSAYVVRIDREGRLGVEAQEPEHLPRGWTAEHLLLAGLARCSLAALAYHARRAGLWMAARAEASGTVTRRDDASWGFVEIECALEVELDPAPDAARIADLAARAETGCFVGQSLSPRPTYRWRVNGSEVTARAAPS